MKRRHYFIINLVFVGFMALSAGVVFQFMTGYKPLEAVANLWQSGEPEVATTQCDERAALERLSGAGHESLKKLAIYQQACRSFVTDTMMVFVSMAPDQKAAREYATQDAKTLKTFADVGIRPLLVLEPTTKDGKNLDFELFANGTYRPVVDAYYEQLKDEGIRDEELGIITPFPEANLPYWNNNKAKFFAPAMNSYLTIARQHFPRVETAVLLNSATYDADDFNWENGDYSSLLPYVKGIQPDLVTYAGLQGFPWISRQGGVGAILNAAEFLSPPLLEEMAEALDTKQVWFNTGTFSEKYTLDPQQLRTVSPQQRKEVLLTIKDQAVAMQNKGYDISVNIFAEDKSDASEETNWSYWQGSDPFLSPNTPVFTSFVQNLRKHEVSLWLFDQ